MSTYQTPSLRSGALLALAIGLGLAVPAQASDLTIVEASKGERYADVIVRYDDLNLDSTAGARKLYARLSSAAERACGGEPEVRELKQQQRFQACHGDKLEEAVNQVGHRNLAAVHADRSRSSVG